jgi:putative hydrolase of the HAD superfamily
MKYRDLIFDLYGTLVDIHTEESAEVWEKCAIFFGFYGAKYTGKELKAAFLDAMKARQIQARQSYECFPDIPFEQVMAQLLRAKGVETNADSLGFQAAQLFRVCSMDYIRLYPGALQALEILRRRGHRLWLLSNAQRAFTAYELRHLGLDDQFDAIYISSDYGCRKPDSRFLGALLREQGLDAKNCIMIGNDRDTDIAGAKAMGLATLYMHTNITPPGQAEADPALHPSVSDGPNWEFEGSDWEKLVALIP